MSPSIFLLRLFASEVANTKLDLHRRRLRIFSVLLEFYFFMANLSATLFLAFKVHVFHLTNLIEYCMISPPSSSFTDILLPVFLSEFYDFKFAILHPLILEE